MEWAKEKANLEAAERELDQLRQHYKHEEATSAQKSELLEQESRVAGLRERVNIIAKRMRSAELKK